ncbi:uncharacterized protein B0T23DRAFT_382494 [Neurospora hispaniola]|uniref:Uncharacterized protein n=1 Tax=Neurospora hispaniola TaxID=588809 RepID=A0AAJ0MQE0_9PEZI|nr:hypothetical protein B0T23DRAFT_382494 [Neurospora hispaniola]
MSEWNSIALDYTIGIHCFWHSRPLQGTLSHSYVIVPIFSVMSLSWSVREARGDPNSPLHRICLYAPWWLNRRDWRDWTPGAGNDLIGVDPALRCLGTRTRFGRFPGSRV